MQGVGVASRFAWPLEFPLGFGLPRCFFERGGKHVCVCLAVVLKALGKLGWSR